MGLRSHRRPLQNPANLPPTCETAAPIFDAFHRPKTTSNLEGTNKMKQIRVSFKMLIATATLFAVVGLTAAADKNPNIVMLIQDCTGSNDFSSYSAGRVALLLATPAIELLLHT